MVAAPPAAHHPRRRWGRPLTLTLAATLAVVLGIGRDADSSVGAVTFTPPAPATTAKGSDGDLTPGVLAALQAQVRRSPGSALAREELGTAYLRLQRWRAAERQLRALVRLTPKEEYPYFALGHALAGQGEKRAAQRAFAMAEALVRG